jgi:DNA invertase Pin-like site-specific DNA recombinase
MLKAFSYVRVSSVGQVTGDGFPRQRAAIADYAKAHGVTIVEEFQDLGVSGTKELADRPALAALLAAIEANGVRTVLVERADRLARDLLVSEVLCGEFRKRGVRVLDADGVELTAEGGDPTRVLIRQVLGAVAEFEKSVLVLKLKAARDRKRRETGRCEGRHPFGFHPTEQAVLERMRKLRRGTRGRRMSFADIAAALNTEGVKSRMGRPWTPGTVFDILSRQTTRKKRQPVAANDLTVTA